MICKKVEVFERKVAIKLTGVLEKKGKEKRKETARGIKMERVQKGKKGREEIEQPAQD